MMKAMFGSLHTLQGRYPPIYKEVAALIVMNVADRVTVFAVCGGTQCPTSSSLIASPLFSDDVFYNDTNYHCIWTFNCRNPYGTTVLQLLAFNRDRYVDCNTNFVEIREGWSSPLNGEGRGER